MAIMTRSIGATDTDPASDTSPARPRPIPRRSNLPNGRALVGGLLVVIAVLALFGAYRAASKVQTVDYLIVRHEVAAGRTITAADLALAPMVLYRDAASQAFTHPDDVIGKVALVGLSNGSLVERDHLADAALPERGRRVSLELEPAQALNGRLSRGDRVDVIATTSGDAPAVTIERDALVSELDGLRDDAQLGVGGSGERLTVTLVVPNQDSARRLVDARAHGTVTLVGASAVVVDHPRSDSSPEQSTTTTMQGEQ